MTIPPRRTKKELMMLEQEKAVAFRQGISAFKAKQEPDSCPYQNNEAEEHKYRAWLRGFKAERKLRTEINPRERRSL